MRRFRGWLFAMAAVVGAGCDPCQELTECFVDAHVSAEGSLVQSDSGEGVAGVSVDFIRIGGVGLAVDSVHVETDGSGRYVLRIEAEDAGNADFRAVVSPPGREPYPIPSVVLPTSVVRGDALDLGRWVVDPFIGYIGELQDRRSQKTVSAVRSQSNGSVVFKRTGGVAIDPDVVNTTIGLGGRFFIQASAAGAGTVTGRLRIKHPDYPQSRVIDGFSIRTRFEDTPIQVQGVLFMGLSMDYVGEIFRRSAPVGFDHTEFRVRFERTGGVKGSRERYTVGVQSWGGFFLNITPESEGTMVGDITVLPPPPLKPELLGSVALVSHQDETHRWLGRWGVGPSLNYSGEVFRRAAGEQIDLDGVAVQFTQTGGVSVTPQTFSVSTLPWGGFSLRMLPATDGVVRGDLVVNLPPPRSPWVIPGIELETFRSDEQRLAGRWGVGEQVNYGATLVDNATGVGIAGAQIEFVRTGGITMDVETIVQTTTSWGGFFLQFDTNDDGEVVGDLRITLSLGATPIVISGVQIVTFAGDEQRYLGTFGVSR
ncbi:MAG: hypothetical protein HOJ74_00815 [Gemmatimonadales bacterium]|nr:hypothetical protein [Gemmatimonadales bacterium]